MVSFSIAGIIQSIDKQLFCYDTSYCTYREALLNSDNTLNMVVAIVTKLNTGSRRYMFIDMRTLLSDYLSGVGEKIDYNVNVWADLEEFLTKLYNTDVSVFDKYLAYTGVPRYQYYRDMYGDVHTRNTPFYTNMTDSIEIVSLGYTNDIKSSYVDKDAPLIRDLPGRRISLPDLVFSKANEDVTFDLENTLVSIDGVVCYPIYSHDTNELYACNGARFLKNTTDSTSLNIILMNFANLGKLHHYKLSDCKQELLIKDGEKVWLYHDPSKIADTQLDSAVEYWHQAEYSMRFTLPENAVNGHPLLCLAGRLFFPGLDDLVTYTNNDGRIVVEFHIANDIIEKIVASNLQHQNLFYSKSAMFRVILSYVFCNIFVDQAYEYDQGTDEWLAIQFHLDQIIPFITMIETDKEYSIDKYKGSTTMDYGKIIFPPYTKGLLMNADTRELIDYTRIPYKDQTLITFSPQNALFIEKREGANTNNNLLSSDAISYDEIIEFAPSSTEIVYNTREHRYKLNTMAPTKGDKSTSTCITVYGQSQMPPYETDDTGALIPYQWDASWGTPIHDFISNTWTVVGADGLPIYESIKDTSGVSDGYKVITWYKVNDYRAVVWYQLWDGTNIITDGVRTDRMAWQLDPTVFIDPYNRYQIGEYIKDPKHYQIIDICIKGDVGVASLIPDDQNPEKLPDPVDDVSNPMIPVYTAEYERVRDEVIVGQDVSIIVDGTTPKGDTRTIDLNGEFTRVKDGTYNYRATWSLSKRYMNQQTLDEETATFTFEFHQMKADYTGTTHTTFKEGTTYYYKSSDTSFKRAKAGTVEEVESGRADYVIGDAIPINTYYECNIGIGYWTITELNSKTSVKTIIAQSDNGIAPTSKNAVNPADAKNWALIETTGGAVFGGTLKVTSYDPRVLSQFKIEPTITNGKLSTTMLVGKNAANIKSVYSIFDGKYRLASDGLVGIDRIWVHQNSANIVIKYIKADAERGIIPHWAVLEKDVEVFITDAAVTGSAPYTSALTWRLKQ